QVFSYVGFDFKIKLLTPFLSLNFRDKESFNRIEKILETWVKPGKPEENSPPESSNSPWSRKMEMLFLLSHHYERVKLPAASANKWILGNMRFPEDFLLQIGRAHV